VFDKPRLRDRQRRQAGRLFEVVAAGNGGNMIAFIASLNEVTLADLLGDRARRRQFKNVDIAIASRAAVRRSPSGR